MDKWEKGAAAAAGAMLAAWELGVMGRRAAAVEAAARNGLSPAVVMMLGRLAEEGEAARRITMETIARIAALGGSMMRDIEASKEAMP